MEKRPGLSAVVITLNEERNLERCLASLSWADEILVVDSGSTDRTREIAEARGCRFIVNQWLGYGQQKNFAMSQVRHDWVLSIDADEEVPPVTQAEIINFLARADSEGYLGASFARKTWYLGRWILHGGWYPNRLVRLVKRSQARWTEPPVHEELRVSGKVRALPVEIQHYSFANVSDQIATNVRFARLGAQELARRGERGSLLRILTKPIGKFLETYVWKRGFLDGFPGFVISINAAHSIFMKYVELRLAQNSRYR